MDAKQIKEFIDAMAASDLAEMELSHGGWTLRLSRGARTGAAAAAARPVAMASAATSVPRAAVQAASRSHELVAPMYGVVHLQPSPGEPVFARAGDAVEVGQLLCIIEAMKVFNEVRAERGGRLASVLVPTGIEVEAGQTLMVIEPVA
ncbi:MAG: acetyl-CoA carboxylase biotin carboxyl carrier protein subunit [Rhodoferax sp.]|nr:acetyl-CoA carboxylase biotin carboxyl carrier protein subunit [Rhodoferax sp.]